MAEEFKHPTFISKPKSPNRFGAYMTFAFGCYHLALSLLDERSMKETETIRLSGFEEEAESPNLEQSKHPIAHAQDSACFQVMKAFRKANRFSLFRGSPMPLWMKARAQAIGFRLDDLERAHWKKVGRSMCEDEYAPG